MSVTKRWTASSRGILILLLVFAPLVSISAPAPLYAQENREEPSVGLLIKGPEFRRGISVLYPNAIPSFYGEYSYEDITVRVFYTEEPIAVRDSWGSYPCAGTPLARLPERRDLVLYYEDERGWKVFFVFPARIDEGSPCRFIEVFLARLTYFLGITGKERIVPLPAVLRFQ